MSKPSAWIEAGYHWFAFQGPDTLKTDPLAKTYRLTRSSYYYHFKSHDRFFEALLEEHRQRGERHIEQIRSCPSFHPHYPELLVRDKEFLFFQKQLAFRQDNVAYKALFESIHDRSVAEVAVLFRESFGLTSWSSRAVAELLDRSALQFFAGMDPDAFSFVRLVSYFRQSLQLFRQLYDGKHLSEEELDELLPLPEK